MTKIFISYRRQDTRQIAGRIYDRLEAKFGSGNVFMDIDNIPFGVDFHDYLSQHVSRAETVLALIGHGWADANDEFGVRRLDNPNDFVRIEIETAIKRGIPLGAVLIDGAPIPKQEQLPETMRPLLRRNAAFLDSGRDFNVHVARLIADLEGHLNGGFVPSEAPEKPRVVATGNVFTKPEITVDQAELRQADKARLIRPDSGKSFRDFAEGPEMVVVPAGEFMMGSPEDELGRQEHEGPQHRVTIPKPFAIGCFPVTFAEWDACLSAGGTNYRPDDSGGDATTGRSSM